LKRCFSLKGRTAYREVYQKGRKIKRSGFALYVQRLNKTNTPMGCLTKSEDGRRIKIGIALNKKFGNSCQRNVAKRRIRALCRELIPEMDDGFSVIIRLENEVLHYSYEFQRSILRRIMAQGGALK
jgi:ribonuclease P protein component